MKQSTLWIQKLSLTKRDKLPFSFLHSLKYISLYFYRYIFTFTHLYSHIILHYNNVMKMHKSQNRSRHLCRIRAKCLSSRSTTKLQLKRKAFIPNSLYQIQSVCVCKCKCVLYVVIKCIWIVALPLVHILDLVGAQEWWWGVSEARSVGTSYLTAKANNMLQHEWYTLV